MINLSVLETGWYQTSNDEIKYIYVNSENCDDESSDIEIDCMLTAAGNIGILNNTLSDTYHFKIPSSKLGTISYLGDCILPNVITTQMAENYSDPTIICRTALLSLIMRFTKRKDNSVRIQKETKLSDIFAGISVSGIAMLLFTYFGIQTYEFDRFKPEDASILDLCNYLLEKLNL